MDCFHAEAVPFHAHARQLLHHLRWVMVVLLMTFRSAVLFSELQRQTQRTVIWARVGQLGLAMTGFLLQRLPPATAH